MEMLADGRFALAQVDHLKIVHWLDQDARIHTTLGKCPDVKVVPLPPPDVSP